MSGSPPHTDLEDLVAARVDQAVDERIDPAVAKLMAATDKLEDITPLLVKIDRRQDYQSTWLIILSAFVGALIGMMINISV